MQQLRAKLETPLKKSAGRLDFQRGHWSAKEGQISVKNTRNEQGSHILTSLATANCYIALEDNRGNVDAGEEVTIWLFDDII